jgi:hypothetical protein
MLYYIMYTVSYIEYTHIVFPFSRNKETHHKDIRHLTYEAVMKLMALIRQQGRPTNLPI